MSDIYLSITETPTVVTLSQPVAASQVAATVTVGNTVTVALDANSLSALEQVTVTVGAAVSVSNFPASQVVTGSVAVTTMPAISISSVTVSNFPASQVVSVSNLPASQAVTVSNFPATQTIAGTVTANVFGYDAAHGEQRKIEVTEDGYLAVALQANNIGNVPISGTVTANVSGDWGVVVTSGVVGGTSNSGVIDLTGYPEQSLIEVDLTISNGSAVRKFQEIDQNGQYPGNNITLTKAFDGSTVVNLDPANSPSGVYVFRNPSGKYIRFAYVSAGQGTNTQSYTIRAVRDPYYGLNRPVSGTVTIGNSVTIGSLPAISGTVTANVPALDTSGAFGGTVIYGVSGADVSAVRTVLYSGYDFGSDQGLPVDGTNPLYVQGSPAGSPLPISGTVTVGNSVTIGAMPNGALTTRFGTPTTANTAFATSAVTNTSRKYLLIQNVTTGSNVITVGIGFTPTTTQGIQLTAGAGITFESSYIPTGAVQILSSVTASNFTILEA